VTAATCVTFHIVSRWSKLGVCRQPRDWSHRLDFIEVFAVTKHS
jgi:hypothetical protein